MDLVRNRDWDEIQSAFQIIASRSVFTRHPWNRVRAMSLEYLVLQQATQYID